MNRFLIGMLTFFVISSALVETAWSAEAAPSSIDFEFEEKILEPETLVEKDFRYEIRIGKEAVYSVPINPSVDDMNRTLGFELPEALKAKIIANGGTIAPLGNPLESFESMSTQDQIKFRHARLAVLRGLARFLHYAQPGITVGMITKDTLSYIIKKGLGKTVTKNEATLKERRHQSIQSLLNSVNNRLFFQAPLIIKRNEIGLFIRTGPIALSGVRNKGMGGLIEAGLSVGFNTTTKSLIFELVVNPEKFHDSAAMATVVGVNFKAGVAVGYVAPGQERKNIKGTTFYPPMLPGFSSTSQSQMEFGASSGLGFPPPPLADLLTFTNNFEKVKILRVSIPVFTLGFPRIVVGELGSLVVKTHGAFHDAYIMINDKIAAARATTMHSCPQIF